MMQSTFVLYESSGYEEVTWAPLILVTSCKWMAGLTVGQVDLNGQGRNRSSRLAELSLMGYDTLRFSTSARRRSSLARSSGVSSAPKSSASKMGRISTSASGAFMKGERLSQSTAS